ncbi:glycosyltransferase, partial [Candidatus Microgenomates bacterium]|nr:glycosyltransferase [Candidatus Microgenomates bacterium]
MKKTKPKLSVVIVTYNGEKYTSASIRSILASSSSTQLEVIIVDNGSPNKDTAVLKKKFGNKITVITLDKNYGPSKARNEGSKRAQGEYLAFLDNDTLVHK